LEKRGREGFSSRSWWLRDKFLKTSFPCLCPHQPECPEPKEKGEFDKVPLSRFPQKARGHLFLMKRGKGSPPLFRGDPNPLPIRGSPNRGVRGRRKIRKTMGLELFYNYFHFGVTGREG